MMRCHKKYPPAGGHEVRMGLVCVDIFSVIDIDCDNYKFCIFNDANQSIVADAVAPLLLTVCFEGFAVCARIFATV